MTSPPSTSKPAQKGKAETSLEMAAYTRVEPEGWFTSSELVAIVLSLLWLAGIWYGFTQLDGAFGDQPIDYLMGFVAIFLPIALIWVGASAARTSRVLREEATRLQSAIDAMRHAYLEQQQRAGMDVRQGLEDRIEGIAKAQQRTEATLVGLAREQAPAQPALSLDLEPNTAPPQANLALGRQAEELPMEEPLTVADYIRAVNFPENEHDKEGFRVLRRALQDRRTARLIEAAQDMLTLMSEDGIYMDDLTPDRAKPDLWRKFAQGMRGRELGALGGIHDRASLALTSGRMKSDTVFRDTAFHFLRRFDDFCVEVLPQASDVEISQFADTRTARAFMVLGRVTGVFD